MKRITRKRDKKWKGELIALKNSRLNRKKRKLLIKIKFREKIIRR